MKKSFLIVCLLLTGMGVGMAQKSTLVPIMNTKATYRLPDGWKYLSTTKIDSTTTNYLYCYQGKTVAAGNDTTMPFLSILVKRGYKGSVYDYAYSRYGERPFQTLEDYVEGPGLPHKDGLGYIGAYQSRVDGKDYQFRMIYFKEKETIVEFRLETTRATFDQMKEDFETILESINF